MFGYANTTSAPALATVVSDAVKAAQADAKSEERIQSAADIPSSPVLAEVKAVQATRTNTRLVGKAPSPPTTQLRVDTKPLVPPIAAKPEQAISSTQPLQSATKQPVPQENPEAQKLMTKEKVKIAKAPKSSISSLDDIMSMLENETIVPKPSRNLSQREKEMSAMRDSMGKGAGKRAKAPKPSISSLDEMMSMLEQDWNVGSVDRKDSVSDQSSSLATVVEQDSKKIQPDTQERQEELITLKYVEEPEEIGMYADENRPAYRKGSFASSASSYRGDLFSSPTSSYRKDSFTSPASSYRQNSITSATSFAPSEPKSFVNTPEKTQAQTAEEDESSDKPILDYIQEAEEMRLERSRMEFERQKFLEEEAAFQREADRFAEEEEQMRKFVEDLAHEQEVELENQERKQRIAEERRLAEEAEAKRLKDLEDEKLAIQMAEKLNAENERIETERREREARLYRERVDLERQRYVEEEARLRKERMEDARRAREEEDRNERARFEEERARLEAERVEAEEAAERERRAEEERLEQERYEEEEARRFEEERIVRDQRRAARERAEEAQRDFERREKQRIAQEQRRVQKQQMERMRYQEEQEDRRREAEMQHQQYQDEDSEPEVLTKEQELAKAEAKIRAAFAGLAEERDQLAKGVKPASKGPSVEKVGLDVGLQQGRGVSRYNTVAGGPRTRQENSMGVARGNTVAMRPPNKSIGGGLPSGPRGGFGLPRGPRAGLPSGPRPQRI